MRSNDLSMSRGKSRKDLSIFLLTRGLWLVVMEVALITFLLQLSYQLILLQVIWAIGWSMMLFAAIIWLPKKVIAVLAFILLAGHNLVPDGSTSNAASMRSF